MGSLDREPLPGTPGLAVYGTRLKTKSALDIKAATLNALWMISGGELGEQKAIASLIGEELLISILQDTPLNSNEDTHILHQVACEALGVLCRGPRSRQKQVLAAGAAKVYMTILRSKNPRVVIEVLRLVFKMTLKVLHFDWPKGPHGTRKRSKVNVATLCGYGTCAGPKCPEDFITSCYWFLNDYSTTSQCSYSF